MPYFSQDDIAQIGTPPGPSPVGAIRISGANAFAILARACTGLDAALSLPVRRGVAQGEMRVRLAGAGTKRPERIVSCPVRVFLMPAPASYTREDVAEIHLPGSPAILRAALRTLVEAGARLAAAGEFTFRAFRNGRLALGQAEAVEELIRAENDAERRGALSRLGDCDLDATRRWRDTLMDIAARVEAALDFSEEELGPDVEADLAVLAAELAASACLVGDRAELEAGHRRLTLAGLTNAGKSSLFNRLLGEDAVIVSAVASTTRDRLVRRVCWDGVLVDLSDIPGYDPDGPGQGGEAAVRGLRLIGGEDLAIWVVDSSRALDERDARFAETLAGGVYIVMNKIDLPCLADAEQAAALLSHSEATVVGHAAVSAATGAGIDELRCDFAQMAAALRSGGGWNRRELLELTAARASCRKAAEELGLGGRLELAAEDLRHGVSSFSRMLGEGYAEEALGRIFSRFCIGK